MADNDFIDLKQELENPKSDSNAPDSDPNMRDPLSAFLIALPSFICIGVLFFTLVDRPYGIQVAAMAGYTFLIPYILSNRFLQYVPWELLSRFRSEFLLAHSLALAVVFGIATGALAIKPRLPDWFVHEGRKGSIFDVCFLAVLLIMAFYETSWMSGHKPQTDEAN